MGFSFGCRESSGQNSELRERWSYRVLRRCVARDGCDACEACVMASSSNKGVELPEFDQAANVRRFPLRERQQVGFDELPLSRCGLRTCFRERGPVQYSIVARSCSAPRRAQRETRRSQRAFVFHRGRGNENRGQRARLRISSPSAAAESPRPLFSDRKAQFLFGDKSRLASVTIGPSVNR